VVSDVARRADIGAGQLYRWRKEFRTIADGFAQVLIAPPEIPAAQVAAAEPSRPKPESGFGVCEILADGGYADILTGGSRSSGSGHTYGFRLTRAWWSAFALASNTSS